MKPALTVVALFFGVTISAHAATQEEIKKAFDQAQKKGAVAVYEERCGSMSSIYFEGSKPGSIAKTVAAMSALAAQYEREGSNHGCAGGLEPGQSQMLELYPDGSVKAR